MVKAGRTPKEHERAAHAVVVKTTITVDVPRVIGAITPGQASPLL